MTNTSFESQLDDTAKKLSLESPMEGFLCVPARYEDYAPLTQLSRAHLNEQVTMRLQVSENPNGIRGYANRYSKKIPSALIKDEGTRRLHEPYSWATHRLEIDAQTETGEAITVIVFGAIGGWRNVELGQSLIVNGKLDQYQRAWQINSAKRVHEDDLGKVLPVYLGIAGQVNSDRVTDMIDWLRSDDDRLFNALTVAHEKIIDACGGLSDIDILNYCANDTPYIEHTSIMSVLGSLHGPHDLNEAAEALEIVKRICILGMQYQAKLANARDEHDNAPIGAELPMEEWAKAIIGVAEEKKGFALTFNQKEVALQIVDRIQDKKPMVGLLSGEVGAGKTLAYAIPAVTAHRAGARVVIMAPTLLLANQIAKEIAMDLGEFAKVERVFAGRKIRDMDAILVGTSGLNSVARKQDYVPDLVIFDEQHKLNTLSREEMISPYTHTLEVSATPIPRSLALSFYDGVDLFTLNEQPLEKTIKTSLIDVTYRGLATMAIKKAIKEKKRVALVFTLVDSAKNELSIGVDAKAARSTKKQKESEEVARRAAGDSFDLFNEHFPDQVVLLHGQMSDKEKEDSLDLFRSGERPILITTTIFETGIDVPDVSTLIIRDPQNLGLSQLHQLRGRLARKGGEGNCFLLCENLNELADNTYERLHFFTQNNDGYELALHDMKTSGAGDLAGYQQRGKSATVFQGVKLDVDDFLKSEQIGLDIEAIAYDTPVEKDTHRQVTLIT